MRRQTLLALVLASCGGPASLPFDAGAADTRPVDAPGLDAFRVDAMAWDADTPLLDPSVPLGMRTLHPMCDVWAFDLDEPRTYDSPAEVVVAIADAACRAGVRCGSSPLLGACQPHVVRPAALVVTPVDVVRVRACLEELNATPCPAVPDPASCRALFVDTAPDGASCTNWTNCASRYCRSPAAGCGGTCAPMPVCPTCGADQYCLAGSDTCLDLPRSHEPCEPAIGCVASAYCDVFAGACLPLPGLGDPCSAVCARGLGCDRATLTCTVPHTVSVGDACDQVSVCPEGSDCVVGVCTTRPAIGEPCRESDHACAAGGTCNQHGRCGALVGPGCTCDEVTTACPYGFACVGGACQWLGAVDVPCVAASPDCYGERCVGGTCSVATRGEACTGDLCFDGPCVGGVCEVAPAPAGPFCWDGMR